MTKASSCLLLISSRVVSLMASFLPHTKIDRAIAASKTHKFSMYFDDISRSKYVVPWNQDDDQNNLNFSTARGGRGGFRTNADGDLMKNYSEQKLDALHKSLYGYDPQTASRLSIDEVEQDIRYWYENSDIGRIFFQTKDFESNNDLIVCPQKDPIACVSFLWEYIDIYTRRLDIGNDYETMMVIFPYCSFFYNYETMEKCFNSVKKCGDLCSVFGKYHEISQFHPTYKNEPKMLSLIRHAPFPSFALHKKRNEVFAHKELISIKDENQIDYIFGRVFDDDNDITSIAPVNRMERNKEGAYMEENIDSVFREYIDQRRNDFEALFNSDAAISPSEGEFNAGVDRNRDYSENKSIERKNSDHVVIAMTKDWMRKSEKNKERKSNKALRFSGSINDRWIITNSTSEEDLYKEIWSAINQLQNHYDESLCEQGSVISTMFITTKYSIFNANQFKRFAISINGMLKEFTNGQVFLELFHPEYVGKKSSQSKSRRTPFPTLQICRRHSSSE